MAETKCPRSKDYVDLVLALVNDYTVEKPDGTRGIDAGALSRDAQALRYLIHRGVRPWEVTAWRKDNPGGLREWSDCLAEIKKKKKEIALERHLEAQAEELPFDYDDSEPSHLAKRPSASRWLPLAVSESKGESTYLDLEIEDADVERPKPVKLKIEDSEKIEQKPISQTKRRPHDCVCADPDICALKTYRTRFALKNGEKVLLVLEGDDSYAGAHFVYASKRMIPGTEKQKAKRLNRYLERWNSGAVRFKV
jgi:hypothetical protein